MLTLIEGARLVVTQDDRRTRIPGGFVLVRDRVIEAVGSGDPRGVERIDRRIDARGKAVLPGLVNTHHHLPQTLTRNVPRVQEAPLFRWLTELYEGWRGTDAAAGGGGARRGPGGLLLTGRPTPPDPPYPFPPRAHHLIHPPP